jgi:hypothetical protein
MIILLILTASAKGGGWLRVRRFYASRKNEIELQLNYVREYDRQFGI